MEVVAIELKTFEKMQEALTSFREEVKDIVKRYKAVDSLRKWLDTQDVCLMLNISKRTLQTYKNKGFLAYSRINGKNYFKLEDVVNLLENQKNNDL